MSQYQIFEQALGDTTVAVAFNGTSTATAVPTRTDGQRASILELYADQDFRVAFGTSSGVLAVASGSPRSKKMVKNFRHVVGVPRAATHFAVVQDSTGGTVEVTPGEN